MVRELRSLFTSILNNQCSSPSHPLSFEEHRLVDVALGETHLVNQNLHQRLVPAPPTLL